MCVENRFLASTEHRVLLSFEYGGGGGDVKLLLWRCCWLVAAMYDYYYYHHLSSLVVPTARGMGGLAWLGSHGEAAASAERFRNCIVELLGFVFCLSVCLLFGRLSKGACCCCRQTPKTNGRWVFRGHKQIFYGVLRLARGSVIINKIVVCSLKRQ